MVAASISGVAARCCQHRKLTEDEALEQIAEALRTAGYRPGTPDATEVLTRAAATYATVEVDAPDWFHPAALELLVRAGADADEARKRRLVLDRRPKSFG